MKFKVGDKVILFRNYSSHDDTLKGIKDGYITIGKTYLISDIDYNMPGRGGGVRLTTSKSLYGGRWVGPDCIQLVSEYRNKGKPSWL